MNKPFQRIGSISNAEVGSKFELAAQKFFKSQNVTLNLNLKVPVGIGKDKKDHAFDLGCKEKKILVECKSHKWTASGNVPSAKLTVWNEAMYYFYAAPKEHQKIMFVLRDYSEKRSKTLAEYYLNKYRHLVTSDVEFWEYDEAHENAVKLELKCRME